MDQVIPFYLFTGMKFPRSESGEFKKPSNYLYSRHYRPIVKDKVKFN